MALLQRGKTKDVYSHGDYTLELKFTDRVTLNDQGEVVQGGNNVIGLAGDRSGFCLPVDDHHHFQLSGRQRYPDPYVSYDLDNLSMVVRKAVTFKPGSGNGFAAGG